MPPLDTLEKHLQGKHDQQTHASGGSSGGSSGKPTAAQIWPRFGQSDFDSEYLSDINHAMQEPDPPAVLYHVAPKSARDDIATNGIDATGRTWNTGAGTDEYRDEHLWTTGDDGEEFAYEYRPEGVYMFSDLSTAKRYAAGNRGDLYEIDTEANGRQIVRDPSQAQNWDYIDDFDRAYVTRYVEPGAFTRLDVEKHLQGKHDQKTHGGGGGTVTSDQIGDAFAGTYVTDKGYEFTVQVTSRSGSPYPTAGGDLVSADGRVIGEWARGVNLEKSTMKAEFLTIGKTIHGRPLPGAEDALRQGVALTMQRRTEEVARQFGLQTIEVEAVNDGSAAWAQERFGYRFAERPMLKVRREIRGRSVNEFVNPDTATHEPVENPTPVQRRTIAEREAIAPGTFGFVQGVREFRGQDGLLYGNTHPDVSLPEVQRAHSAFLRRFESPDRDTWPAPSEILALGSGATHEGRTFGEYLLSVGWEGVKPASHVTKQADEPMVYLIVHPSADAVQKQAVAVRLAPGLRPVLKHGDHSDPDHDLGIGRRDMPQIDGPAFRAFLRKEGVRFTRKRLDPAGLRRSQNGLNRAKVQDIAAGGKPLGTIITSRDRHILDGHHRWAAAVERGVNIDALVVDLGIEDLLALVERHVGKAVSVRLTPGLTPHLNTTPGIIKHLSGKHDQADHGRRSGGTDTRAALTTRAEALDAEGRGAAAAVYRLRLHTDGPGGVRAFSRGESDSASLPVRDGQRQDVATKAVHQLTGEARTILREGGISTPVVHELDAENGGAEFFHAAISRSKEGNPYASSVFVYDQADYRGMRLFVSDDGQSGIALKGDEVVSLFKTGTSGDREVSRPLLELAIQEGGRRGDCFDTVLPQIYAEHGLEVRYRVPWDDSQAPDGWDKRLYKRWNNGEPDVTFFRYNRDYTEPYRAAQGTLVDSYDDAVSLTQAAVLKHLKGKHDQQTHAGEGAGNLPSGWQEGEGTEAYRVLNGPNGTRVELTKKLRPMQDDRLDTMLNDIGTLQMIAPVENLRVRVGNEDFDRLGLESSVGGFVPINMDGGPPPPEIYLRRVSVTVGPMGTDQMMPAFSSQPWRYSLVHEYGHVIDHRSDAKSDSDFTEMLSSPKSTGISRYGQSNGREAFAEAWTGWIAAQGQSDKPFVNFYADRYGWDAGGAGKPPSAPIAKQDGKVLIVTDTFGPDGAQQVWVDRKLLYPDEDTSVVAKHGDPSRPNYAQLHPSGAGAAYAEWGDHAGRIQEMRNLGPSEDELRAAIEYQPVSEYDMVDYLAANEQPLLDDYIANDYDLYREREDIKAQPSLTEADREFQMTRLRDRAAQQMVGDDPDYVRGLMGDEEINPDALRDSFNEVYGFEHQGTNRAGQNWTLQSEVVQVDVGYGSVSVVGRVTASGTQVGVFQRTFSMRGGEVSVEHSLLQLKEDATGTGFATEFNARAEDYYISHGIGEVTVHAALNRGGYAWAASGYDWDPSNIQFSTGNVRGRIDQFIAAADSGSRFTYGSGSESVTSKDPVSLPGRQRAQLQQLRDRLTLPFSDPDFPTPSEIADFGEVPGVKEFPGLMILAGSNWYGVKTLSPQGRRRSLTEQQTPTGEPPMPGQMKLPFGKSVLVRVAPGGVPVLKHGDPSRPGYAQQHPKGAGSAYAEWGDHAGRIAEAAKRGPTDEDLSLMAAGLEVLTEEEALEQFGEVYNIEVTGKTKGGQAVRLRSKVTYVSTEDDGTHVDGTIVDHRGNEVGTFARVFKLNEDTTGVIVEHDLLELYDEQYQGLGFATQFNAQAEDYYISHGVREIRVHAALDVGGYTWASAGFDFDPDRMDYSRKSLQDRINSIGGLRTIYPQLYEVSLRMDLPAGHPDLPTPFEISRVGWSEGADTWIGKQVMVGSDWYGVKPLRAEGRRLSTTEQRNSQGIAKHLKGKHDQQTHGGGKGGDDKVSEILGLLEPDFTGRYLPPDEAQRAMTEWSAGSALARAANPDYTPATIIPDERAAVLKGRVANRIAERMSDVGPMTMTEAAFVDVDAYQYSQQRRDAASALSDSPALRVYLTADGNLRVKAADVLQREADMQGTSMTMGFRVPTPDQAAVAGTPEAAHLVRRAAAGQLVRQWARSANDEEPLSLAIQDAAKAEFGIDDAMEWTPKPYTQRQVDGMAVHQPVYRRFVREQYNETQAMFRDMGVGTVTVYRGMGLPQETADAMFGTQGVRGGEEWRAESSIQMRPLSSWATDAPVANLFAENANRGDTVGVVITSTVPVSQVFSTPYTGSGCYAEKEMVLLGSSVSGQVSTFAASERDSQGW